MESDLPVLPVTDHHGAFFLDQGESIELYDIDSIKFAKGYTRVVRGGRGCYIEISPEQIICEALIVPHAQKWRLTHDLCFYDWYTTGQFGIKIYHQKREVSYADYKIGFYYVAPREVVIDGSYR